MALLEVEGLKVRFDTPDGVVHAVNGLSFTLEKGQTLGLVGESGSGKSQTALALLRLLADNGRMEGRIRFRGRELTALSPREMRRLRGNRIAMIFQDPMTSLNPHLTIERQMTEVLELHQGLGRRAARHRAIEMLEAVRIPDAARRIRCHPHEFSGGMRQRVMIAMALLCRPDLLIADEPTTALDVTVQAGILRLLRRLQEELGMSLLLITHDLGVVAALGDRVLVLYAGRACEEAAAETLFTRPAHPYTRGLLESMPRLEAEPGSRMHAIPGSPPDLRRPPAGCPFLPRCPLGGPDCAAAPPGMRALAPGHRVACHLAERKA